MPFFFVAGLSILAAGGAGLLFIAGAGAGVPWAEDGPADEAFLARPSDLIFSDILIGMMSPPGVAGASGGLLLDGSSLLRSRSLWLWSRQGATFFLSLELLHLLLEH